MRNLRLIVSLLLLMAALPGSIWCGQSQVLYGAMVYVVSSAEHPIGGFLEAEIQKRKLPIILSPDRANANYVLAAYAREAGVPAMPISGSATRRPIWEAKVVLANLETNSIAWSVTFRGPCAACDASPENADHIFAAKFAKRLQKDLFEHESISDRIDDVIAP